MEPRGHSLRQIAEVFQITADDLLDWGRKEDPGVLLGLSLSALAFLVIPLLGILLPLVIWISNRNKVKGADALGKKSSIVYSPFFAFIFYPAFLMSLPY